MLPYPGFRWGVLLAQPGEGFRLDPHFSRETPPSAGGSRGRSSCRLPPGAERGPERHTMFGIGMPELILLFVLALLVFGPKKLPEIGKQIGRALGELRRASEDLKEGWAAEVAAVEEPAAPPAAGAAAPAEPAPAAPPAPPESPPPAPEPAAGGKQPPREA